MDSGNVGMIHDLAHVEAGLTYERSQSNTGTVWSYRHPDTTLFSSNDNQNETINQRKNLAELDPGQNPW